MGLNICQKIIKSHLVSGEMVPGQEVGLRIDQTLTQDATGTMAYLQFEAMQLDRVRTELSVSYVDHNMLQADYRNMDDHRYLQSVAARYGIYFSRPGNGICHQVHLERFAAPGKTLLGSDSHTPTAGGVGSLAIGAGGLDVATAMACAPFYVPMPGVIKVNLTGALNPWVAAKDVILELLRRISVKGGVGYGVEYGGPGVATLSVPQRASITNMGAELGATTSVFPSDATTLSFLKAQDRAEDWIELLADVDADYDQVIEIDLSTLVPLVACPHSPDNVKEASALSDTELAQVCIGSCTNSSVVDLETVAAILKGKTVAPGVSLTINPGSKQALTMIAQSGALAHLVAAGARIMDPGCGACIGMGQAPATGANTLRSYNRNFEGRSGTADAMIYLASAEVCAASALAGRISDPRTLGQAPVVKVPESFVVDDNMIIAPLSDTSKVEVMRGPNIKPLPTADSPANEIRGELLLKTGDNITTDHIMPAGAQVLPFRSNIPAMSDFVFVGIDPEFPARARQAGGGFIVGGENYGQGSSREHAALVPMYLGIKAVIVKSFARIHKANLVNFGILPLVLADPADYERIDQGDTLRLSGVRTGLQTGANLMLVDETKGLSLPVTFDLSERQIEAVLAGGLLNHIREQASSKR